MQLTNLDHELTDSGAREKNRIDSDDRIHIPQELTKALKDGMSIQPFNVWNDPEQIRIRNIHEIDIPYSRITPEEFREFTPKYRSGSNLVPRALLSNLIAEVIALVFLTMFIVSLVTSAGTPVILLGIAATASLAVALFGFMHSYSRVKSLFITPQTGVARGKVLVVRRIVSNSSEGNIYLSAADIAFFENNTFVRRMSCSDKAFAALSPASDVLVVDGNIFFKNENGEYITE